MKNEIGSEIRILNVFTSYHKIYSNTANNYKCEEIFVLLLGQVLIELHGNRVIEIGSTMIPYTTFYESFIWII